jgi:transposase-like protein
MAKKGQIFNTYTKEFKEDVVSDYMTGQGGYIMLGKKHNIPWHTIEQWVKKSKGGKTLENQNHLKGRRKDKNIDYKERYEILKKYQAFLKAQRERK